MTNASNDDDGNNKKKQKILTRLPVSLLSGFLGAGKTTLLQHILTSKHKVLKCAVIVNDMAELNIDKSLIDQSALVQSDDVIAMENGCVCCSLRNDFVEQIIELASKGTFDYMLIEASGVAEPKEVAAAFAPEVCDDDHEHEEEHGESVSLHDVARLDTCVTVVDASQLLDMLDKIRPNAESAPQLVMEQIECANILLLNKMDLVQKTQIDQVRQHVKLLNPTAKLLESVNAKIDVNDILDTHLYKTTDFGKPPEERMTQLSLVSKAADEKACCVSSRKKRQAPCCPPPSSTQKVMKTELSQIILSNDDVDSTSRHSARFGINSFVYKARRPFHPKRFHEDYVDRYFVLVERNEENAEDEDENEDGDDSQEKANGDKDGEMHVEGETEVDMEEEDPEARIARLQEEATKKKRLREQTFGSLLRSKGFSWIPEMHDLRANYSQAGNIVTIETPAAWDVLDVKAWNGTDEEKKRLRKDWVAPFGDRRQELIFIGQNLKPMVIQEMLDDCLLDDEEFSQGVDAWKAIYGDVFLHVDGPS